MPSAAVPAADAPNLVARPSRFASTDAGNKMRIVFGETELSVGEALTDEAEAQRRRKRTDRGAARPDDIPPA